jgi:hypothetical protein
MEQARRTEFTADEFIAWALEQATGRFELDNGAVVAMAPERVDHTRAKRNVTIALHNAIGARELPCEVLPDGASVRVNDRTVYEPDALIRRPLTTVTANCWDFLREPMIAPTGFREYDARWRYPEEINLPGMTALGLGLGTQMHERGLAPESWSATTTGLLAGDQERLALGLMQAGIRVRDIGRRSRPWPISRSCISMRRRWRWSPRATTPTAGRG